MSRASVDRLMDQMCDAYEAEHKAGKSPGFVDYLEGIAPEHQPRLLRELWSLQRELTPNGEEAFDASQLKQQYPHLAEIVEELATLDRQNENQQTGTRKEDGFSTMQSAVAGRNTSEAELPSAPPADLSTAKDQLENYKLLQVIGEGGMGTVWMADQLRPVKRRVAIKIIKREIASPEVVARFEAERQAMALMNHPCIARILDAGTTASGQPYFAMELVKGITLTEYCDSRRLNLRERLELFTKVCDAIQHAHQKGILHRDLKPSNILVGEYNAEPQPKVIDFGLAKAVEAAQQLTEKSLFTEFGQVLGTLKYMSPEQAAMDSLDVDTRTDIYALGVILYELLTGTTPLDAETFKGQSLLKVLELVREQDSPRPSLRLSSTHEDQLEVVTSKRRTDKRNLSEELSGDLDWIVMKALDKDRSRRYDTANGLGRDVARYLNNEPIEARPPSAGYRLKKLYQRNRAAAIFLVALAGAVLLGLAGTTWFAIDASLARAEAVERQLAAESALRSEREVSVELIQLAEQLANNYLNSGDRVQALPLFQKALEKSELVLGPDSPSTLEQMHSVAFLLGLDGRIEEAVVIQEKVMNTTMNVLGPEAPQTHSAISNLAASRLRLGQVSQAVELFEQVYQLRSAHVDPDDFAMRISLRWAVIVYSMTERWEDALPITKEWLEHLERANELESPEYAWATASLAAVHCGMGNYESAEKAAKSVLELPASQPDDKARAENIMARCQANASQIAGELDKESIERLGSSYLGLKRLLDDLPGFKQFFITNACKRNIDAFETAGQKRQTRIWENELQEIEEALRDNRKPVHAGIPTYDPATGTEKERFAPIEGAESKLKDKEFSAEDQ